MFLGGLLLLGLSLLGGHASEYLKDGAFHLGAAGLVLMIVDPLLRKESNDFVRHSIQETVSERIYEAQGAIQLLIDNRLQDYLEQSKMSVSDVVRETMQKQLTDRVDYISQAVSRNGVHDVLAARLNPSGDGNGQLSQDLTILIENLDMLRRRQDWARDVYVEYLSEVIQSAGANTVAFCGLTSESASASDLHPIKLASPAERTDKILARLMEVLPNHSTYHVISDIESWTNGKLADFGLWSAKAVSDRGVIIRRIFLVLHDDLRDGSLSPDEAYETLKQHLESAVEPAGQGGSYQVRLLDTTVTVPKEANEIVKEHYGIFIPPPPQRCLQVRVDKRNFSKLSFANLPAGSDESRQFDRIWNAVLRTNLTAELLSEARDRWRRIARAG
jgi:hypothetical protein